MERLFIENKPAESLFYEAAGSARRKALKFTSPASP